MDEVSNDRIEEAVHFLAETVPERNARSKARLKNLEKVEKSLLADLKQQCNEKSATAKENFARRHPDYAKWRDEHKQAVYEDERNYLEAAAENTRISVWQTWTRLNTNKMV